MRPTVQLLAYRFSLETAFEGQVTGALERLASQAAVRVLDMLFVGRDGASGEVFGIDLHSAPAGASLARLLTFRLDPGERSRATRAVPDELLGALGDSLAAGEAVLAILVAHEWARPLQDAVARLGGTALPSTLVGESSFTDLVPHLANLTAGSSD